MTNLELNLTKRDVININDYKLVKGKAIISNTATSKPILSILEHSQDYTEKYTEIDIDYGVEIIGNEVMIILEHPVENIVEIRDRNFYYPLQRKRAYTKFIEPTTARIYITKKGYIPKPLNRKYLKMRRANIKDLLNTWEHIWQSATTEYEVFLTYKDKVKNKVELMDAGANRFHNQTRGR